MILHYKEGLTNVSFYIKTPLKYSKSFTFIPIQYKYKGNLTDIIFQSPHLFIPYGVTKLSNGKLILDISFQNSMNDKDVDLFYAMLQTIYSIFQKRYSKEYQVHNFCKDTPFSKCMRCKLESSDIFYNQSRNKMKQLSSFHYGRFLLQLSGLWVIDNEVWFQWFILQGHIETPIQLDSYSFIDDSSGNKKKDTCSTDDKYQKMLKMGIPQIAVDHQRKLDGTNIPPPPPLNIPTSSKHKGTRLEISSKDLLSVTLKKTQPKEIKKNKPNIISGGFEPPSKEELQIALSKLQKIM
tara:strand:+ start:487 stop:1368 length:882 start_codon:yes stop_codon:yes gene_type:complete